MATEPIAAAWTAAGPIATGSTAAGQATTGWTAAGWTCRGPPVRCRAGPGSPAGDRSGLAPVAVDRRRQPGRGAQDRDGSVGVRPQHPGALGAQRRDGAGRRMAVRIADTAGDQRQARRQPMHQRRVLIGGAVVRHLQDIDAAQLRVGRQQCALRGWFEVTQQQKGQAARTDEQGDAGVIGTVEVVGTDRLASGIGGARGAGESGRSRWPQDLPGEWAQVAPLPRYGAEDRHPCRRCRTAYELRLPWRVLQRRGLDRTDRTTAERPREPVHMVGVEMCQDQKRDAADTQVGEAAVDGLGLGSGVHHQRRTVPGCQHQAVALPHVTHHGPPPRRRPSGEDAGERGGAAHCQDHCQHAQHTQPGTAQHPADDRHQGHQGNRQHQPAAPAARPVELRPRQRRPRTGDAGDPLSRPARAPRQRPGGRQRDRGDGKGREAQHRRGGHGHFRQQIAGHRDQAHPGRQHGDHRCADRLGSGRGGDHLGDPGRYPAPLKGGTPAWREQQQRAGRQDRQQKAITTSEPRVVEDQQQDRGGEGGEQRATASGADGQKCDQAAGGGPQHARVRAADHDEGESERAADDGRAAQ